MLKSSSSAAANASQSPPSPGLAAEDVAEALGLRRRLLEHLVRVVDRLAPVAAEEVDEQRLAAPLVQRLAQRDDVAERLRHLLAGEPQHPVVHPEPRELVPERARLRDLVLVVREDQVEPAAVDLEHRPEVLLGHRRALDVPARPAAAPRRVPPRVLALLVRLPEREVARILLQRRLLGLLGRIARRLLVAVAAREPAVVGEARDAEVDVAARPGRHGRVATSCSIIATISGIDSVAFGSTSGRPRPRPPVSSTYQPLASAASFALAPGRGRVDLVVDVGDVLGERHLVAAALEPALEPHRDHERARVADVDALVDRRAAEVHPDRPGRRRAAPAAAGWRCHRAASILLSASSRGSAATTVQSSGPRSRPVSASRERAQVAADRLQLADRLARLAAGQLLEALDRRARVLGQRHRLGLEDLARELAGLVQVAGAAQRRRELEPARRRARSAPRRRAPPIASVASRRIRGRS